MGTDRIRRGIRIAAWVLGAVAVVAAFVVAQRIATDRARAAVSRSTRASAILLAASFRRDLDKFRLVPIVLAEDRDARDALLTRDRSRLDALSRKLESLSARTRAANVYLLDARGVTVATSNWRRPDSFLGDNYAFRAYYRQAMATGDAQQFALGQRSRLPGLYISKRLAENGRPLGVFVVKVDFSALEQEWRETATAAFVTDARGIMLVTSNPGWRFQTIRPLSVAERRQARRSLDYGSVGLVENPLYRTGAVARVDGPRSRTPYVEAIEPVAGGWRVHVVSPTTAAVSSAVTFARLTILIAVLAFAALYLAWRYRRRIEASRRAAEDAARLGTLRDQLIQANKLATLGQVAAGVGHEINQPVAAIAAYAHNARAFVTRAQPAEAAEAIDRITALTQRIGLITRELRGFARRASGDIEAVPVEDACAGVGLLLHDRLRTLRAQLTVTGPSVSVRAERVRLEQVLLNLVQNALDAGAGTVEVRVEPVGDRVRITIADDGAGLSPEVRAGLFQPFTTAKKDGLGLGLVICRDIVTDLGGTLEAGTPERGAEFVITLERAT